MSLLLMPESSRFEQVALDKAIEMAEKVIKLEKELRLGETGEEEADGRFVEISPMKYFIFDKMGEVFPIWGEMFGKPQENPNMDSKQQIALLVKILVHVLQSRVVLHITEGWTTNQCHQCGEEYGKEMIIQDKPCECGAKRCQPRENPYAHEVLMCNIAYFQEAAFSCEEKDAGEPKFGGYVWIYEINRDHDHKITGFTPRKEKDECGVGGRMSEHWVLYDYEAPHFMLNYASFCDALNVDCDPLLRTAAEHARSVMPKNYPLLSWGMHTDIDEVVKIVKNQHEREMSEFN